MPPRFGSQREASLVVLPSAQAQWDLKLSDIIRIGVLHPCWYVATVDAIKLRNNIFLATRTIHSYLPLGKNIFIVVLSRSRLCARPFGNKNTGFSLDFFTLSGWRRDDARQKSRDLRPKGRPRLVNGEWEQIIAAIMTAQDLKSRAATNHNR